MASEKMMILNMLQKGKITAEEASKLLSTVDEGDKKATAPPPPGDIPISNNGPRAGRETRSHTGGSNIDFDELGRKFAAFAKDLEPKIHKVTEVVAEKTVELASKFSESFETSTAALPPKPTGQKTASAAKPRPTSNPSGVIEKQVELLIDDGYNELSLDCMNGDVSIKGYNGDKISAYIRYKTIRSNAPIELMKLGGKYYLNYEEDDFQMVAIDAYVPSNKFKIVNISGMNGNMDVSGLNCEQIKVLNSNGQTKMVDLTAESIKSESGNGRLTVANIAAPIAIIEHFNGIVEAGNIDAEKLNLTNFNGSISMSISAFERFSEYLWSVETSNAKLTMNVPSMSNLGYHILAHVTLGNIRAGLTGLEFAVNDPTAIDARTADFDSKSKKVRLSLETSNAALTVN